MPGLIPESNGLFSESISGLDSAARSEANRNIENQQIYSQAKAGRAQIGAMLGGAGGALGGAELGAGFGSMGGPIGMAVGGVVGAVAGMFASKL